MRHLLAAAILLVVAAPRLTAEDYPSIVIKNEKLKFTLYETDAKKGFYRGTRFDHAGVFGNVEFAKHKIFGPWKDTHDPTNHDDIVGTCDEFGIDSPLGYDDAKVGGTFLKIGVGELEKPKEAKYSFANKYKVVKPLEWKVSDKVEGVVIEGITIPMRPLPVRRWETEQKANGYGYSFSKTISLFDDMIEIDYKLKNTGEKRIVTDFYNHNFFNVDGDPVGPSYSLEFQFAPKAKDLKGKFGELVELKEQTFRFKDKLSDGFVMATLTGFDAKNRRHPFITMCHAPSGVNVDFGANYSFAKLNVWGIKTTICPEPYMAIDLEPGEEMKWLITYSFTHEPPPKK